jgi:tRNA pseudouridine55 synthase
MQIHGVINLNKPEGISSLSAVKRVKKILYARKAGHTGTLDPLATGVLPVCINEATKLVRFLIDQDKEYSAIMVLGAETDTGDMEGEVVARGSVPKISKVEMEYILKSFVGKIMQIPPVHCAKKKKGIPLYRMARMGMEVEVEPVEVQIYSLKLKEMDLPRIAFDIHCSKGTYIRALVRDIGRRLGCGGYLFSLKRIRCGPFRIESSIEIDHLKEKWEAGDMGGAFLTIEEVLKCWPSIVLDGNLIRKVKMGMSIQIPYIGSKMMDGEYICILNEDRRLVAISKAMELNGEAGKSGKRVSVIRPVRIFSQ